MKRSVLLASFGSIQPKSSKFFTVAPNFLIKLLGLFSPLMKTVADQLGKTKELDNSKAKNILGWQPRSGEEAVIASAKSLIEFDIVKSP